MLYLKKINYEDIEEEYKAIKSIPAQENGFEQILLAQSSSSKCNVGRASSQCCLLM